MGGEEGGGCMCDQLFFIHVRIQRKKKRKIKIAKGECLRFVTSWCTMCVSISRDSCNV